MTKARDLANGGFGLVLMKPSSVVNGTDNGKGTVSFSAQTSVSLNDVFNSTYANYKIICTLLAKNSVVVRMRLRSSGTDATGSNYAWALGKNAYTTSGTFDGNTETSWIVGNTGGAAANFNMDFCNPNLAERTNFLGQSVQSPDVWIGQNGTHTLDTSYTGFTIFPASGTLSGTISVYGYNK